MTRPLILSGLTAVALCLAAPLPASAQNNDGYAKGILDLPAGQTVINLSTSERVEVDQDLLVANLRYEAENKDARALQNDINSVMQKAVEAAKAVDGVKIVTQQYYVYPHDYEPISEMRRAPDEQPSKKTERVWRGSQSLEIKSSQADAILELTGDLQDMGLVMSNLSYTLSPEKSEETRDSLMEGALEKLKAKADRAAKALGKSSADLLEVNVDGGGYQPPMPMMRTMAMEGAAMDKMSAPVAEPGQTEINMTVSARALLKP